MKNKIKNDVSKAWYKSKTIVVNSLLGLLSLFNEFGGEVKDILESNMPFLREIDSKWYIGAIAFLIIFNIVNRIYTDKPIAIKKKKDDENVS